MKRNKGSVVAWMGMFLVLGMWGSAFGEEQEKRTVRPVRMGVVDVIKVLRQCRANLEREKVNEARTKQLKATLDQLQVEANAIREELENVLKPGSEEYNQRLQEWFNKMALREAQEKGQLKALEAESQVWMERMYEKLLGVVEELALEEGLDLVLNKDQSESKARNISELLTQISMRKVLFNVVNIDLTGQVLERIDRLYEQVKMGQ